MKDFTYSRPDTLADALDALQGGGAVLAGGTTMVDLIKLGVHEPDVLVDITALTALEGHEIGAETLRFGALARMADVGDDPALKKTCPALSEALWKAASPQLRNTARLGGNLLQRTRCPYFRDTAFAQCNKRAPGSGCAALDGGHTGLHAVLGGSDACVAMYPGDWAAALIAFDAVITVVGPQSARRIAIADLHVAPGDDPATETVLRRGEIITEITVPVTGTMAGSTYLKARNRESYAFAAASAAVGVALDGDAVTDARIGLGGVATTPWRAREAEAALIGRPLTEEAAREAGRIAFRDARPMKDAAYKIALGASVVAGALVTARKRAKGDDA